MTIETRGLTLELKTPDGKLCVQSTARPIGTFMCFTSEGDRQDNPLGVGNGNKMIVNHHIGDSLQQDVYIDLNVKENRTFISEGYANWNNCFFDEIHFNIVPKLTPYTSGTNTTFNLYGGFMIVPAAGDGTIQVNPSTIQLVEIPYSLDNPTVRQSAAFWDADYSTTTHTFSNIRPNITGTGQYNIFGQEINFETVADICLLNFGQMCLRSNDVAEFGHGMRIKLSFITCAPDHAWSCAVNFTLSRQLTSQS